MGWVGIGSLALQFTASVGKAFALVAMWLLALGVAATVATRGNLTTGSRTVVLVGAAALTAGALLASVRGGGSVAVLLALTGWAAMTALASGVVRALRLTQTLAPRPPIAAASAGALCAGLVLGDPGDVLSLTPRLAVFVVVAAMVLAALQRGLDGRRSTPGCRAGLFDCSLPAWPVGAWRDAGQWPVLLAGVAMLPMMAALPLMADWCRAAQVPAPTVVLLHLFAMFGPAWLLQGVVARLSLRLLALLCMLLLVMGALGVLLLPSPWDWLCLVLSHGAAWGLAWTGQLWAPARRGQQGTSPVRAAAGYAVLTLAFGLLVQHSGPVGVVQVHVALGGVAALAWLARTALPLQPGKGRSTPV